MKLSKPSKQLIKRINQEVGFNERFTGYRLHKRMGAVSVDAYSFKEIINLLNDQHPRIDLPALNNWLTAVIGDSELAEKINEISEMNISEHEKSMLARDIMHARLKQCRKNIFF